MAIKISSGQLLAENVDISASKFCNSKLLGASFSDVNLKDASFDDVALTGAKFHNVCLKRVAISNANYDEMTIDGILVSELFRVFEIARVTGSQSQS